MKLIISLLIPIFMSGCAVAPLLTQKSGRSLGKNNWVTELSVLPSLGASLNYGVTEDLDIGVLIESQLGTVYSLYGKYSFVNNEKKWSVALGGGAFMGVGFGESSGFFLGPIVSYKADSVEPYLNLRYNYVSWKPGILTSDEQSDSLIKLSDWLSDINFSYVQADFGINFWVSEKFAITPNGKAWIFFDDEVSTTSGIIPGISFLIKF